MYLCRVGMDTATVQVRMDNLKIEADIAVGSRGNPSVTNTFRNMAEVSLLHQHDRKEKFMLFSDPSRSLLRRQPRAWINMLLTCRNNLLGSFTAAVSIVLGPSIMSLQAQASILLSKPICCSTSHGHIAVASAEACCFPPFLF